MKPTVKYLRGSNFNQPTVGQSVFLTVLDHPKIGKTAPGKVTQTSAVVSVGKNGEFETQNNLYVPAGA
jgi:hypothetical protein